MRTGLWVSTVLLVSLGFAQGSRSFWDAPTQGRGNTQGEVLRLIQASRQEVFAVLPALYSELGQTLRAQAAKGVEVRVVLGVSGLPVSSGIALLQLPKAQLRVSNPSPTEALLILDRKTLIRGPAVWNPRGQGFVWVNLPANSVNPLLDSLRYLWQAAKPR